MAAWDTDFAPRIASRRALFAFLLVVTLGTGWSLQYAGAKLIGEQGLPPFGSLFTVHVLLSLFFITVLSMRCELFLPTLAELAFFFIAGFLGNVLTLGAELAAAAHISAGLITLILSMAPIFTIAIAFIARTEAVGRREAAGLALGAAAAAAILLPQAGFSGTPAVWVVVAFIAPIGFALYTILLAARWPRRLSPIQVATGVAVAATAMLAPMASQEGDLFLLSGRLGRSDQALLLFTLTMAGEYYLVVLITRMSGAIFASCADFIAIAMGLFWSFVFFDEVPDNWMWLAAGLCVAAVVVVNRQAHPAGTEVPPVEARIEATRIAFPR